MRGLAPTSAPPPHSHRPGGFTLVEALAAIAVMVILLPVLMRGFGLAGNIASLTRQKAEATALAQSELDELIATQDWQFGTPSGNATFGPDEFQWTTALGNYQDETGAAMNVQTLTITVHWNHRGVDNQIVLETLVYIPGSTVQSTTGLGGGLP